MHKFPIDMLIWCPIREKASSLHTGAFWWTFRDTNIMRFLESKWGSIRHLSKCYMHKNNWDIKCLAGSIAYILHVKLELLGVKTNSDQQHMCLLLVSSLSALSSKHLTTSTILVNETFTAVKTTAVPATHNLDLSILLAKTFTFTLSTFYILVAEVTTASCSINFRLSLFF